jgi:hypothetical protein
LKSKRSGTRGTGNLFSFSHSGADCWSTFLAYSACCSSKTTLLRPTRPGSQKSMLQSYFAYLIWWWGCHPRWWSLIPRCASTVSDLWLLEQTNSSKLKLRSHI